MPPVAIVVLPTMPLPVSAAGIHGDEARRCNRAVDIEDAAIHRCRTGVGIGARQDQRAGADLLQRSGPGRTAAAGIEIGNHAADLGRPIVAAGDQRIAGADEVGAGTADRAGVDAPVAVRPPAAGEVDDTAGFRFEARGSAVAAVEEVGKAVVFGVMKALPAVLWFRNAMPIELLLMIVASPAVLRLAKSSTPEPLLWIVAPPAVLRSRKCT